jgi:putative spermidine/putrescine transport system substrate-binding protein
MRMRTRAIIVPVIGAVSALAVTAAHPGGAHAADLVVNAFGGIWEKAFRECYVKEFEARTGKSVDVVVGNPIQLMNQVEANRAKPPIDVIINSIDGAYDAIRRDLVDRFDEAKLPHLKEINPEFVKAGKGFGTILNYGAMGIAYNTKAVKNPPKDWKDFVDRTIKGEWRAAIPSINYQSTTQTTLWMFAHVYGGGIDDVTPGIEQIKKMKASGNLVFWSDVNQFLNLLKSGEIDIGMYWDGRTWAFRDAGNANVSYVNPKPGAVINPTLIQKVKNGSPLAYTFIDLALEQKPQACFGNQLQYGMSNTKVTFDPKVQPRITKMDEILWPPFEQAPAHFSEWVERWNKEIGG